LQGKKTASGARFNPHALTAAHRSLPLGTRAKVTNLDNGKAILVTINDRGPFRRGRVIDLSRAAARQLAMNGTARIRVEAMP
jgi:rare lipoprotein A